MLQPTPSEKRRILLGQGGTLVEADGDKGSPAVTTIGDEVEVSVKEGFVQRATLSWEGTPTDDGAGLDCSAVAFNGNAAMMDGVYINTPRSFGGAMIYEDGLSDIDRPSGKRRLRMDLAALPDAARAIVILFGGSTTVCFQGVSSLRFTLTATPAEAGAGAEEEIHQQELSVLDINTHTNVIVAGLCRQASGDWSLRILKKPTRGFTYYDAIDDVTKCAAQLLGTEARAGRTLVADNADFVHLRKGELVFLPEDVLSVAVGLGWHAKGNLDLDASAAILGGAEPDGGITLLDTVWFYERESKLDAEFVRHSGDAARGTGGGGKGDDEVINVRLQRAPKQVESIVFCVNIYGGHSFQDCYRSYVALRTDTDEDASDGKLLAFFSIDAKIDTEGIIFARLFRCDGRWAFQSLGIGCSGETVMSLDTMEVVTGRRPGVDLELDLHTDKGCVPPEKCCAVQ